MKKQINDLLLKMQSGETCIGETANKLFDLKEGPKQEKKLPVYDMVYDKEKSNGVTSINLTSDSLFDWHANLI